MNVTQSKCFWHTGENLKKCTFIKQSSILWGFVFWHYCVDKLFPVWTCLIDLVWVYYKPLSEANIRVRWIVFTLVLRQLDLESCLRAVGWSGSCRCLARWEISPAAAFLPRQPFPVWWVFRPAPPSLPTFSRCHPDAPVVTDNKSRWVIYSVFF